jgi:phosphatidylserine/phosphatidylglycerophosphate/cardiolipin synthase-like enzyme
LNVALKLCSLSLAFALFSSHSYAAKPVDCKITAHFPSESSLGKIVTTFLGEARTRAKIALYGFNNMELAEGLIELAQRNVAVAVKIDAEKSATKKTARLIERLKGSGIHVQSVAPDGRNHNKFAVIDGTKVVTGSYNWTAKAESNWENLLVIDCQEIARQYERAWERIH